MLSKLFVKIGVFSTVVLLFKAHGSKALIAVLNSKLWFLHKTFLQSSNAYTSKTWFIIKPCFMFNFTRLGEFLSPRTGAAVEASGSKALTILCIPVRKLTPKALPPVTTSSPLKLRFVRAFLSRHTTNWKWQNKRMVTKCILLYKFCVGLLWWNVKVECTRRVVHRRWRAGKVLW